MQYSLVDMMDRYRRRFWRRNKTAVNAVQYSTAQHSAAQHSTAQHITSHHSTAQHSAEEREWEAWPSSTGLVVKEGGGATDEEQKRTN